MANRLSLVFDILAKDRASKELEKVGDAAKRTGDKAHEGGSRAANAFGLLGKTLAASAGGALGPITELTDKLDAFHQAVEGGGGGKRTSQLFGLALAASGAGALISSLHSQEQGALQQLQASVEATGHSFSDYREELEKAAASGAKFGNTNAETLDALNRLTVTTHSPEEAIKALSAAFDIAATKHVPLAKAAETLGLAFNGSTKAGKQFGVQLENTATAGQALVAAQKGSLASTKAAKDAQASYAEKLDLWNNSSTKTRSQAYALAHAHDLLVQAQDKAKTAADRLKTAQDKAAASGDAGARNVQKLADVVKGQGSAAADTFSGHLKQLRAAIENTLGAQGKLGQTLLTVGAVGSAVTGLASAGVFSGLGKLVGRLGLTGSAFKTLRDTEILASAEGTAAVEANALAASEAVAAEATSIEASALRMRGALGAVGAGLIVGAGLEIFKPWSHTGNEDPNVAGANFSNSELDKIRKLLTEQSYTGDARANAALTDKLLQAGKISAEDQKLLYSFLETAALKGQGFLSKVFDPNGLDPNILKKLGLTGSGAYGSAYGTLLGDLQAALGVGGTGSGSDPRLSDNPNVATRAQGAIDKAVGKGKPKAKAAGDSLLQTLLNQLTGDQAKQAANKAAENAAQNVVDALTGKFQAAQSRLQSIVSDALSLRQSVTSALQGGSALTDIFQGPDLNANGAFGKQNNFGRVRDFLQRRVAQERKFVLELRQLIKQGLDPSLVAQIASAGVDGGGRVAEAILSGGQSGIGQVNGLERQIASLANTTGKTVADQHYARQIAEQRHNTEVVGGELKIANARLAAIQGNTAGGHGAAANLRTSGALAGI